MIIQTPFNRIRKYLFIFFWLLITSCSTANESGVATSTLASTPQPSASASLPAPVVQLPLAILLVSPESEASLVAEVEEVLAEFGEQNGMKVEKRTQLTSTELPEGLHIVVALPPDPGIEDLAASAPQVQFIAVGIMGLQASSNLTVIAGSGENAALVGFAAGYTAAIITDDWRVGVLAVADTSDGQLFRQGFITGAKYFCGLCNPTYPPYHDYPLYVEAPSGASPEQWRAAADQLLGMAATTIYLPHGVGSAELYDYLAESGVVIIGSEEPPEQIRERWAVTIQVDVVEMLIETLSRVFTGEDGGNQNVTINFAFVNAGILSPGKLENVQGILEELLSGYILPVEP